MQIAAIKIGVGVPAEPFSGAVHSAFANAAILRVGTGLVTLTPGSSGGMPGAIALAVDKGFLFNERFAVGASAASRGGVLRFGGAATSVDLRAAVFWRSDLGSIAVDLSDDATGEAWRFAARALVADGRSAAIAGLARTPILALCEATRRLDAAGAEQAAVRLIGLGAGGTPAGDDVLVGFLAGLWSSIPGAGARRHFVADFACRLRRSANRTNDVSRVYLEAAADGEASERLSDLAHAIATAALPDKLAAAAASAIAVGHTSGADGALGLLLGLGAWGPRHIADESLQLVDRAPGAS